MDINKLISKAINGDKTALEGIVASIQDNLYYLSLRILANPDDAKDATQDILIKIITNLSSFRFESQFNTWVYRIASNYLISEKKIMNKDLGLTFDLFKIDLEQGLQEPNSLKDNPDYQVMLNELRINCTMAMMLCLELPHRMAYILGDILEMEHNEASTILDISKDNFRKQLSRARAKVIQFTEKNCGLVNTCAKCSCDKKLATAIERMRVNPVSLNLASKSNKSHKEIKEALSATQQSLKTLTLQQSITHYKSPIELSNIIGLLVNDSIKRQISKTKVLHGM
jgi:RNA polymerase sigma factor (sigma-70 family)